MRREYFQKLALSGGERIAFDLGVAAAREEAFKAGYHCQWIRAEMRYIFDPAMKPGDPDGAYQAWLASLE